jgi:uncharacterized membrane protein
MQPGLELESRQSMQRLEAFSDGVIAIIITIMVLELKLPDQMSRSQSTPLDLWNGLIVPLGPKLVAYVLSFFVVAVLWLNHKALVDNLQRSTHRVALVNMALLFFMSFIPFVTHLIGETHVQGAGVALYGAVLLACTIAFAAMRREVERQATDPDVTQRQRRLRLRNRLSIVIYLVAIPLAFVSPWLALACYALAPTQFFLPRLFGGEGTR